MGLKKPSSLPIPCKNGCRVIFLNCCFYHTHAKIVSVIFDLRTLIGTYFKNPHQFQISTYFSIWHVGYIFIALYEITVTEVAACTHFSIIFGWYLSILWGLFSRAVIIWEWGCSLFLCFFDSVLYFHLCCHYFGKTFSHPRLTTPSNVRVTLSSLISEVLLSCCPSLCVSQSTKKKQCHTIAAFLVPMEQTDSQWL